MLYNRGEFKSRGFSSGDPFFSGLTKNFEIASKIYFM